MEREPRFQRSSLEKKARKPRKPEQPRRKLGVKAKNAGAEGRKGGGRGLVLGWSGIIVV